MSTKIGHGFRLHSTDLMEVHFMMEALRKVCRPLAKRGIQAYWMEAMAEEADRRIALPHLSRKESVASLVNRQIREDWQELQHKHRQPHLDWSFEIALIPGKDYLLGLHYTEQSILVEELFKLPKVEAYPYWNNTDGPKGVTRRSWKARGREWDRALGNDTPAAKGFTYQITSPTPLLWREEQDDTLQPSKEHRLRRMTEEVALSRFWDHDRPNDEGIQEMFRIKDWLRDTDEGRSSREAILEEMARILPESYRVADFLVEPAVEEAR